ncbi:MAG: DNA mismatch repair endonuclease MutL [Candidatus Omnitrophota bacterium]
MEISKINLLTEDVIGKISAGEVVERPASAVKELIDNSIDAGADSIEVEIQSSGQQLIRVADNGEGMALEDAKRAFLRHATSKISQIEDLEKIKTLGFRGEALASIAAVSRVDITTSTGTVNGGVYLYLESGEILKTRPAGRSRGTTIEVRNLFFNVPARLKFLKKESTELSEIVAVVGRFIISNPHIEFKLSHSGRCLLHAPLELNAVERIRLVMGGDFTDHMAEVDADSDDYALNGFVSHPAYTKRDKRGQVFFINGRYVRNKVLSEAVYLAYKSLLERGRYPSAVLFLTVPSSAIDVNVHPAKLEVKFTEENKIKEIVRRAVKEKFREIKTFIDNPAAETAMPEVNDIGASPAPDRFFETIADVQEVFTYDFPEGDAQQKTKEQVSCLPSENVYSGSGDKLFQISNCYIVKIMEDAVRVIDQHAAHERVLYESFSRMIRTKDVESQNMLFPVRLDLSAHESVLMEQVTEDFRRIGFNIEPFGERSFVIQSVPGILKEKDTRKIVCDVLSDLSSRDHDKNDLFDEFLKLTACRAAIKSGEALNDTEMSTLIGQLNSCELPFTCPHGRPTMIDIKLNELEKRFRRK